MSPSGTGTDFSFTFTATVMLGRRITDGRNLSGALTDTSVCPEIILFGIIQ